MDWSVFNFGYTLSGFVVGTVVGLTGVGGGSLMTPLLVLLFGIPPATAVGTDLLYAAITKAGGSLVHARQGTVDWSITRRLAAGSVPAAALTLLLLSQLGAQGAALEHVIKGALGVALLLTAVALLMRGRIVRFAQRPAVSAWREKHLHTTTIAVGALLGALVTLSSVGAGALGVAALFFLYPALPAVRIIGADIAHAVPLTLVAGLGHWWLGSIDWVLLTALLLGSLPGIAFGSKLSARMPERVLRPALATLLAGIGGRFAFGALA